MAVYEQAYKPFEGAMTPEWSRFLVITRNALGQVFRARAFVGLFTASFGAPLVMAILVYLHHNENALAILHLPVRQIVPIDANFFRIFFAIQMRFVFLLTLYVGPTLISADLANNALPLYLCRPFSRAEYIAGKLTVLALLGSVVTWIPGLLIFGLQGYLEGFGWFAENLRIANALVIASVIWILLLGLLALALSALLRWAIAARGLFVAAYIVPPVVATIVNVNVGTLYGNVISMGSVMQAISISLFGDTNRPDLPLTAAWVSLAVMFAACVSVLALKVRAYEVVR